MYSIVIKNESDQGLIEKVDISGIRYDECHPSMVNYYAKKAAVQSIKETPVFKTEGYVLFLYCNGEGVKKENGNSVCWTVAELKNWWVNTEGGEW